MATLNGWQRIGAGILRERNKRRCTQEAFARDVLGIKSRSVVATLEAGIPHHYSPTTIAAVEDVLGWEPGSFDHVTTGGRPRHRPDVERDRIDRMWRDLTTEQRRNLADLAESMVREHP